MNVLGIVGSMRKDRHTHALVGRLFSDIRAIDPGMESEVIQIADLRIEPCRVLCSEFCGSRDFQCTINDDVPSIVQRMIAADALLIGTPLYFRAPPARFHALVERLISMAFCRQTAADPAAASPLRGKPCVLIGMTEYSNPAQVLEYLTDACNLLQMDPVRLDQFPYWGIGAQGDAAREEPFHPAACSREMAGKLIAKVKSRGS
jgi:multimeric flavodoxin WrbA